MAFPITNFAAIGPQKSPMHDIIGQLLSGYTGGVNAKYLHQEKEASIFNKQIAPIAMLANSPYFGSLNPAQREQIINFMIQRLPVKGAHLGGGIFGSNSSMGTSGAQQGAAQPYGNQGADDQQGSQGNMDQGKNDLIPHNPGEHFTAQYSQTPYSAGTAHRGAGGETIYTPTGAEVQQATQALTQAEGLKGLFDKYAELAPKVGGAGGLKREAGGILSGIERANIPFLSKGAHTASEKFGTENLSNHAANATTLKALMGPSLRAIGYPQSEINDMLDYHPGENEKNIKDRLASAWPHIQKKLDNYQKILQKGIKVNVQKNLSSNKASKNNDEQQNADIKATVDHYKNQGFKVTENMVREALNNGIETDEQFRDYLKARIPS